MKRLLPLVLLASTAAFAGLPVGEPVPDAVVLDVTPDGFDAVERLIPGIVPPGIDIPEIHEYDRREECDPIFNWICIELYEYQLDVENGWVDLAVSDINIAPGIGYLDLTTSVRVTINDTSDPLSIYGFAEVLDFIPVISDTCYAYIEPFDLLVSAQIPIFLNQDDVIQIGTDSDLDGYADSIDLDIDWTLAGEDINIYSCGVAGFIDVLNDILGFFGLNIYDFILDFATPLVNDLVGDLIDPDMVAEINDSLSAATIEDTLEVLDGVELAYSIEPTTVEVTPDGMRVGITGSFAPGELHDCMTKYATEESLSTAGGPPAIDDFPSTLPFSPHHMGVFVDDDFLNQAAHAAWYAGLLCFDLGNAGLDLPIPIDTSLLGLLAPGVYDDLFPETEALAIVTEPKAPPTLTMGGAHQLNANISDLGLNMYADLDYRRTRLVSLDIGLDAGVDLDFDGSTGDLGIGVALDTENLTTKVTFNEYTPESNKEIEDAFGGLFDSIVGPLLGPLTEDLAFALPSMDPAGLLDLGGGGTGIPTECPDPNNDGICDYFGLSGLAVTEAGSALDHLGVYATIGDVEYGTPGGCGCDSEGGCGGDSGGCEGGCNSPAGAGKGLLILFPLLLAGLRRRRR